ncbi:MAG TPA: Uma2 family endonuclease [Armatimonadota bacterium]|nr:Uma2 family endonuclease [Armatimonadota bacterium]
MSHSVGTAQAGTGDTIMALPDPDRMPRRKEIFYPSSDGKPMAETDKHRDLEIHSIDAFMIRYETSPNTYVSGNNFLYYEEGNPKKCVSPDVYVVFGVPKYPRDNYKAWEEGGKLPAVVFEFTSRKTQREDRLTKFPLYEKTLKIPELFQFDPTGDYLKPRLQGFRLVNDRYEPIEMRNGRLYSEQLQIEIVQDGERLRFFDPVEGKWLLTASEHARRAQMEANRADEEARRADEEARRVADEARRADEATRRADEEARSAAEHARRADEEARRANEAEERVRRLQEQLAALRGEKP